MLQRKNLLLVEDNAIVLSALCELLLASDEYYITKAESCDDIHLFFKDNHFDLVILNPKMLKGCVQSFLDFLFRVGFSGPIIFSCSVKGIMELEAQNTGRLLACVQRPFKIVSLLECIRRLLSKYEFSCEVIIFIGNIQFYPGSKLIKLQNGQTVNLTEKETNILKYLYRYRDRIVSKEVLLNEVWSHTTSLTTHTLETYIYRLRKKIRGSFAGDELIVTKKGGYQLLPEKSF
jgi:DNA-binding response OmpR family regulator